MGGLIFFVKREKILRDQKSLPRGVPTKFPHSGKSMGIYKTGKLAADMKEVEKTRKNH